MAGVMPEALKNQGVRLLDFVPLFAESELIVVPTNSEDVNAGVVELVN